MDSQFCKEHNILNVKNSDTVSSFKIAPHYTVSIDVHKLSAVRALEAVNNKEHICCRLSLMRLDKLCECLKVFSHRSPYF